MQCGIACKTLVLRSSYIVKKKSRFVEIEIESRIEEEKVIYEVICKGSV